MSWRKYSDLPSSKYLDLNIHKAVSQIYNKQLLGKENIIEKKRKEAERLQEYLYIIKNYNENKTLKSNDFLDQLLSNNFFQELKSIRSRDNRSLEKLFKISGGKNFEKEMQDLSVILLRQCGDINNLKITQQNVNFGQTRTNVEIQKFSSKFAQNIMKSMGINTQKYLNEQTKKNKDQTKKMYYLAGIDIKIDQQSPQKINISVSMIEDYPKLADFANLFLNSSFSLKNYNVKKRSIQLGRTNQFRILTDYLPTLNLPELQNDKALLSFIMAIEKRRCNEFKKAKKQPQDEKIESHYKHIRNIYELTGKGQNFSKKIMLNNDVEELRHFINNGVDFLIFNQYNIDKIYVRSTLDILSDYFKEGIGFSGTSRTYLSTNIFMN